MKIELSTYKKYLQANGVAVSNVFGLDDQGLVQQDAESSTRVFAVFKKDGVRSVASLNMGMFYFSTLPFTERDREFFEAIQLNPITELDLPLPLPEFLHNEFGEEYEDVLKSVCAVADKVPQTNQVIDTEEVKEYLEEWENKKHINVM